MGHGGGEVFAMAELKHALESRRVLHHPVRGIIHPSNSDSLRLAPIKPRFRNWSLTSNKLLLSLLICFAVCSLFCQQIGYACTTFCIDKAPNLIVGRNYDWDFDKGFVVVNKRSQLKTALVYWGESTANLATWTSKYGSITFNQYGRDIAASGMNEEGLVVSSLWLSETQYSAVDSRASLSVDQYVQYLLDNFRTVDEIIATDALIRLRPTPNDFTKIHFFAIDNTGNGAVIEFLNGAMVYHIHDSLPVKAITNNNYDDSLTYYTYGVPPYPSDYSPLARFYRAASLANAYDQNSSGSVIDYSFDILSQVALGTYTKFRLVFDIKNRKIYFQSLANPDTRYIKFDNFDYSCSTKSKLLDINTSSTGNVDGLFIDYTTEQNENLIRDAWINLGVTIYQPALTLISQYPDSFSCMTKDVDGDGMPDSWEITYGLDPLVNDASGDKDMDGYTNIREYKAGTNPADPTSKPSRAMSWLPLLLDD